MISEYKFISKKLIETKEEIKKLHKKSNQNIELTESDIRDIEIIVKTIDGLNKDEIKSYGYTLKKKEFHMLIQYMPENIYNVNIDKIYEVVNKRPRDEYILTFFRSFQNNYSNTKFNKHFINYLNKYPDAYEKLAMGKNTLIVWKAWMISDDLVGIIVNQYFRGNSEIKRYLNSLSLGSTRKLYKDCFKYFLTICNGDDYLGLELKEIIDNLQIFSTNETIRFMNNYLTKLDVENFQDDILEYIYITYDTPLDPRNQFIWGQIYELCKDKYNLWYAKKMLSEFFKGDPRFEFWYEYIKSLQAKLISVNENQLFLDFGNFIVIEFKNIGNAAYVYDKDYFNENYMKYLKSNQIFKDNKFKNKHKVIRRIIHGKNWQRITSKRIGGIMGYDI